MGRIGNLIRNINYLSKHSLWEQRERDIIYLSNKIVDDVVYEYGLDIANYPKPHILDRDESLELILSSGKSFVRTGDGELKIIMGLNQPFQNYDKELSDGLKKILWNDNPDILVGINATYYKPVYLYGESDFLRRHAYDFRKEYHELINFQSTYIHSAVTGYPFGKEDDICVINRYNKWREAFKNKNIVIVCGQGILDKIEYDIFELASSRKYIYGPKKHAWDIHEEIIRKIKTEVSKEQLIVFILGMAGKVMIPILSSEGYLCWDVGHLAKCYDVLKGKKIKNEQDIKKFYEPD